ERRQLIDALISEIQIYEERQPNGQWLKSIKFRLPIIEHDMDLSLDNNKHVETVVQLSLKTDTSKILVNMPVDA
ncbi:MAG: recombinase family protein, partial [Oscillospiraceae bacterium]|nr:recombinase family protein [Oscillospiraceae bacterium]